MLATWLARSETNEQQLATWQACSASKLRMDYVKYSIIIPAYNEALRIGRTLDQVVAYIQQEGWQAEVVVVNDGSRDNTAEIIRQYSVAHPMIRLLENPGNRGKGYSVRNGMLNAAGDVLLFSDADLSAPINQADKLFRAIDGGADVAIGSRWMDAALQTEKQPLYRQLFGRIFNLVLRIVLGLKEKDTQCGFKAFTRRAAESIFPRQRIEGWGFDPELLFLAKKLGFKVLEVPVAWAHDERSKISPVKDGIRMFGEALTVRRNSLLGRYKDPQILFSPATSSSSAEEKRASLA